MTSLKLGQKVIIKKGQHKGKICTIKHITKLACVFTNLPNTKTKLGSTFKIKKHKIKHLHELNA